MFEYHKKSPIYSYLSFSILSSMFERVLGDLYLSLTDYTKPVPSLLRDLLETEELEKVLGDSLLFLIKSIIGPPTGLNLRNIIWHGFISIREYETSFNSYLFILFFTTLKVISEHDISKKFKVRNLINFKSEDPFDFGHGPFPFKKDDDFMKHLKEMLKTSYFQIPGREDIVLEAFELYFKDQNYESLVLILPQLEHAIRRVFVSIHEKLPQEMLMAQSRVLFTTIDIILQSILDNNEVNQLIKEFGVETISFLNDIFIHQDGNRIRDKIAHGMIEKVDSFTTHKLLGIYLYLSLKYNIIQKWDFEPFTQCLKYFSKYQTIYHPKSRFLVEAYELYKLWKSIHNLSIIEIKEASESECAWNDKLYNLRKLDKKDNSLNQAQVLEIFKKLNLKKGFFFEENVEIENPIQFFVEKGFLIEEYHLIESENRKEIILCINMKRKIINELKSLIQHVSILFYL